MRGCSTHCIVKYLYCNLEVVLSADIFLVVFWASSQEGSTSELTRVTEFRLCWMDRVPVWKVSPGTGGVQSLPVPSAAAADSIHVGAGGEHGEAASGPRRGWEGAHPGGWEVPSSAARGGLDVGTAARLIALERVNAQIPQGSALVSGLQLKYCPPEPGFSRLGGTSLSSTPVLARDGRSWLHVGPCAFEVGLLQTERCCTCKLHTRVQRLSLNFFEASQFLY